MNRDEGNGNYRKRRGNEYRDEREKKKKEVESISERK